MWGIHGTPIAYIPSSMASQPPHVELCQDVFHLKVLTPLSLDLCNGTMAFLFNVLLLAKYILIAKILLIGCCERKPLIKSTKMKELNSGRTLFYHDIVRTSILLFLECFMFGTTCFVCAQISKKCPNGGPPTALHLLLPHTNLSYGFSYPSFDPSCLHVNVFLLITDYINFFQCLPIDLLFCKEKQNLLCMLFNALSQSSYMLKAQQNISHLSSTKTDAITLLLGWQPEQLFPTFVQAQPISPPLF